MPEIGIFFSAQLTSSFLPGCPWIPAWLRQNLARMRPPHVDILPLIVSITILIREHRMSMSQKHLLRMPWYRGSNNRTFHPLVLCSTILAKRTRGYGTLTMKCIENNSLRSVWWYPWQGDERTWESISNKLKPFVFHERCQLPLPSSINDPIFVTFLLFTWAPSRGWNDMGKHKQETETIFVLWKLSTAIAIILTPIILSAHSFS
jgi:hypothetical protein